MKRQAKMTTFSRDELQRHIFGLRLCELMLQHQISQDELSAATGISQSKISRYRRSKNEPKLADLATICVYFNVAPEVFLDSSIPIKPLTEIKQSLASAPILGSVENKFLRDFVQTIQTRLIQIPQNERHRFLERLDQVLNLILESSPAEKPAKSGDKK